MKSVISIILFVFFILALFFSLRFLKKNERCYRENRLVAAMCFSSAVWSIGFAAMFSQTDPYKAYLCRNFGMIGVFAYLIVGQMLVCYISEMKNVWRYVLNIFSLCGIPIYFLISQKNQVIYYLEDNIMRYYFRPGIGNTLYTLYTVILAAGMVAVNIYMIRKSEVKRIRAFGKRFLLIEMIILVGMVLDTVFPMFGIGAIPGSTMTQFFGVVVLYYAIGIIDRSRVTIENMSGFIYYSLAMPVLVYDADKKLKLRNDAAAAFFAEIPDPEGIAGSQIEELFEIDSQEAFFFDGNRKDFDTIWRKNHIFCSLAISKIYDSYGDIIGYIIIVTDLSERMKTVKRLEEAISEAETANEAKSIFLANMSHEIRTPMNAIIGFSELALKMKPEKQMHEYLEDIKMSSHNLLAIINDVLDISKIESGKAELVCGEYYISALFDEVYLIIHTQAKKKGLDFQMKVDDQIPGYLYGDKIRIRGILINLLNNAVKYTEQGRVSLEAKLLHRQEDTAELVFLISDTGIGIRQEEQENIFNSFSQVDNKRHYGVEGTGLGLAIVKGYVTLMGGEISLDSVYGQGSVFTVTIPQKVVDEAGIKGSYDHQEDAMDDFSIGSMKISDTRVLVVDDNEVNRKVQSGSLGYYGLQVDTASSGAEAIEMCRKEKYALVFMDQMMPEMDGIEAMNGIRGIDPFYAKGGDGKIIVLTANAISGVRAQLLEQGFDEYVGKPMNYKHLERIFRKFLPADHIHLEQTSSEDAAEETIPQDSKIAGIQELLPQADVPQGIKNAGGAEEIYLQVLQIAYKNGSSHRKQLEEAWQKRDFSAYTIEIHALKGACLNMGANQTAQLARELEKAAREEAETFIGEHHLEFLEKYQELLEQIGRVLAQFQLLPEEKNDDGKHLFCEEELKLLLEGILAKMDAFDFAGASDLVRQAQSRNTDDARKDQLLQILSWTEDMETDKLRELLRKF